MQTGEKNGSYATTSNAKDHGARIFDNPDEKSTNIIRWDLKKEDDFQQFENFSLPKNKKCFRPYIPPPIPVNVSSV